MINSSIRAQNIDAADKIFKIFCALHNFSLEYDGMDYLWEGSVKCDFDDDEFEC